MGMRSSLLITSRSLMDHSSRVIVRPIQLLSGLHDLVLAQYTKLNKRFRSWARASLPGRQNAASVFITEAISRIDGLLAGSDTLHLRAVSTGSIDVLSSSSIRI